MFRFLLSTVSIFVLVSSSLLLTPASARSCSVRIPSTLLSLYRDSDVIYVGSYDKTEEGVATEESESYSIVPIKKYFTITSTLKGEPQKFVVLDDTEYKHKPRVVETTEAEAAKDEDTETSDSESETREEENEPEEDVADGEESGLNIDGFPYRELKPGDSVILFLDRVTNENESDSPEGGRGPNSKEDQASNEEVRLELSDEPYGLKNLPVDRIAAYEARIKELNGIFGAKDPTYEELVAWLVRCAEDPFTRWEGTYQLEASFTALDWQQERAKERAANGETEPEGTTESEKFEPRDVGFAKALTDNQKQELTRILFDRGSNENSGGPVRTVTGDEQLIQLVGRWGDAKVAAGLFDQLATQVEGYLSIDHMRSIASILRDEELSSLMERYSEIRWEDAEAVVEPGDNEDGAEDEDVAESDQQRAGESETEVATAASDASSDDAVGLDNENGAEIVETPKSTAQLKKQTYGEVRAELLQQFKTRATKLLANEDHNKAANVNP